jgi:hypothetical protein
MRKITLFIFSLLFQSSFVFAQSAYIPLNQDVYHWIERYEIKSGLWLDKFHSHIKPYQRRVVAQMADSLWAGMEHLSEVDKFNLAYFSNDNHEWSSTDESNSQKPIFKSLFKKKADFFHYQDKNFDLHINPILHGFVGYERDNEQTPYLNTRGLELRGMIKRKLGFYTYLSDSQATLPSYVIDRINEFEAVPNEGFYKPDTRITKGVDFLTARGYLTFDAIKDLVSLQFGYDRNVIGNGYRSLVLSDYASNYLFLKFNTQVWKLNYQNIFGQLTAQNERQDGFYPQKFFAMHHLSVNVSKNLNIGLFETIIFNRGDSTSIKGYDLRYLNPLIFYRSIEQQAGSPDNANLGLDFKWHFLKKFALYGQVLIDEFVLSEIRAGRGWRGNKQAIQIGGKHIDVAGIANLDLQLELNVARPYTYSHNRRFGEYSHYNQPLAHPLGANFYEFITIIRYQPLKRLNLIAKIIYANYGADEPNQNNGGNIFLNNTLNTNEYGNAIAQGIQTNLNFVDFTASFQLKHNVFVDLKQVVRQLNSELDSQDKTTFFTSLVFRWNIPQRLFEF